ncbi:MAG: GTP 3',8-cyclase MoaA [Oscillospiraceae bacterium]|nr:GTP 3',8-cyclase MoaA [Oscillospiraceae bacterium]
MEDNFGRNIHYLRLSVTDKCNLRCIYCMPEMGVTKLCHEDILTIEEIAEIVQAAADCGINKIRITGGEPLVRKGIINICRQIAATKGIQEVCLTSNGILLPKFVKELKEAGVNRLNISLDSLNSETYKEITRRDLFDEAMIGVKTVIDAAFDSIKINTVLIGGVNDKDILEILELTKKHNVNVRFIEIMPIGECASWVDGRFISADYVKTLAPQLYEVGTDGVSKLYKLPDGQGTVGLISPISSHFCPTCNRIRITADGMLKPCLHSHEEVSIKGLKGKELVETIRNAIYNKPKKHELNEDGQSQSQRNMNKIGG